MRFLSTIFSQGSRSHNPRRLRMKVLALIGGFAVSCAAAVTAIYLETNWCDYIPDGAGGCGDLVLAADAYCAQRSLDFALVVRAVKFGSLPIAEGLDIRVSGSLQRPR